MDNFTRQFIADLGGQSQVADVCGVSQQAVSLWVSRQHIPILHLSILLRIAKVKGVEVDVLSLRPDLKTVTESL